MSTDMLRGNPQFIQLPAERRLSYAESGDPKGFPVIFCHGGPGSTRPMQPEEGTIARSLGIRLITVERPGYGASDPQPGRSLLDWPKDISALADALGLARFSIVGYSAGSPCTLACAARLADRLARVVIVGGGGPMYRPDVRRRVAWVWRQLFFVAAFLPGLVRFMYRRLYDPRQSPEQIARQLTAALGPTDQKLLAQREIMEPISAHFAAGMTHGLGALADDVILAAKPWGFELDEINVPVELWYGTEDRAAPLAMGEYLKQRIPQATLHTVAGEGHLIVVSRWREILTSALAGRVG